MKVFQCDFCKKGIINDTFGYTFSLKVDEKLQEDLQVGLAGNYAIKKGHVCNRCLEEVLDKLTPAPLKE